MAASPETKNPPQVAAGEGSETKSTGKELAAKHTTRSREDYTRERYQLDGRIKRLLRADALKTHPGQFPANVHRSVGCTWVRICPQVSLVRPEDRSSFHYKGLAVCGSVHTCPLCASKIQERRRQEVAQAIAWGERQGKALVMASYTFPHRIDQPLSLLLKLQQEAIAYMRGRRQYIALMNAAGHVGRIRTLEVTHGRNGWHPHTHELLIVDPTADPLRLRAALSQLWLKACRKVGLFQPERDDEWAFLSHAVDVRDGDEGAAGYLAKMDDQDKWGLSHEMTKGSSKQGRASGVHPFKLAADVTTSELFIEYIKAIKGSRQLIWSRGLKKSVGLDEKSDEELAVEEVNRAAERIDISVDEWRKVIKNDSRFELLQTAENSGAEGVNLFLQSLPDRQCLDTHPDQKPPSGFVAEVRATGSVFDWIERKEFSHGSPSPRPLFDPDVATRKRRRSDLVAQDDLPEVVVEQGHAGEPLRYRRL